MSSSMRRQPRYRSIPIPAPKVGWHDVTGYSQGDTERNPTTWQINIGKSLRLTVTCDHIYHKGEWIATCDPFFRERILGQDNEIHAKEMAMRLLQNALSESVDSLMVVANGTAQGDKT